MISTKKLATIATSAAIFASAAMPAFASTINVGVGNGNTLQSNSATVNNVVLQRSSTGNATAGSLFGSGNSATSGGASNRALVVTAGNSNRSTNNCACSGNTVNIGALNGNTAQSNNANVTNVVAQGASTGNATAGSLFGGGNSATSGNASNGAAVVTVVNSNVAN